MRSACLLICFLFAVNLLVGQKRFSEGTLSLELTTTLQAKGATTGAKLTQSIKATHYRSELTSSVGKTTTIYDSREGHGAILREYGLQKIITPITRVHWAEIISLFTNEDFQVTSDEKEIIGYACKKAVANLKDSARLEVFFTDELVSDNPDFCLQFKGLPGLALEYSLLKGDTRVTYAASAINFDPVPIQRFDIPKTGFRVLEYDESKTGKK